MMRPPSISLSSNVAILFIYGACIRKHKAACVYGVDVKLILNHHYHHLQDQQNHFRHIQVGLVLSN